MEEAKAGDRAGSGESILWTGNRMRQALAVVGGLMREIPASGGSQAIVPEWVFYVAQATHDLSLSETDRVELLRRAIADEGLQREIVSTWLLSREVRGLDMPGALVEGTSSLHNVRVVLGLGQHAQGCLALDKVRRGWVDQLTEEEKCALQAHVAYWTPHGRARVVHERGDGIAEREVDDVWKALGREPTAEEYEEVAVLLEEAAAHVREAARRWVP